ncbi:MAG: 50S ribosomal protein L24 [Zetaproteobacteria bacterium]|nr:50S ribosomal protein L24 [Pseudobdellovibrionaceae bacterium]
MKQKTKYQDKCRLKKGDEVIVTTGRSAGSVGKIDKVDYKSNRIFVSGVNVAKKHSKPGTSSEEGGIIDKVMPIHWSNVALVDPKSKKATRVGYKDEGGKKVRFAKASGEVLA